VSPAAGQDRGQHGDLEPPTVAPAGARFCAGGKHYLRRWVCLFLLALMGIGPALATEPCVVEAAERFRLPPSLILAVMRVEGGKSGQVLYNQNGSFDIGPMQINSLWLPEIQRRGGTLELIAHHRCANIHFGTWLLSRGFANIDPARIDQATFWRAVGNYHSRTPEHNSRYARAVWNAWHKLMAAQRP